MQIHGNDNVGGVSGCSYVNNNCHAYINKIKGNSNVGGISGYIYSNTSNCSVIATEIEGNSNCGGITGRANPTKSRVEKCYVAANIIGNTIGGIVGCGYHYSNKTTTSSSTPSDYQSYYDLPISDCRFDGDLNSNTGEAGGILGYSRKNGRTSYDGRNSGRHIPI